MKHISTLLISVLTVLSAWGAPITPEQALRRVAGSGNNTLRQLTVTSRQPKLLMTGYATSRQPAYYVYDRANQGGYMILSADDIAAPVLGYSETGSIDVNNMPSNMKAWLDGYAAEIEWAVNNMPEGTKYTTSGGNSARAAKPAIAPLCTTKWNQGSPFNSFAPIVQYNGESVQCATGCVATAMAQLMKYHNYPEVGTGSNSYIWTNRKSGASMVLSMDFSQTHFDWANMLDYYANDNYSEAEAAAVSTLMQACGYSVNMNYWLESGAPTQNTAKALKEYFGYSKYTRILYRSYHDYHTWVDLIYDNLRNVGPVLFSGYNDEAGHAFIIDGYKANDYFHTNWGWGGMSDGYFLITALTPDAQGIGGSMGGYNTSQCALFGAKPAEDGETYEESFQLGMSGAVVTSISGNYLTISSTFENIGAQGTMIYIGLQFCHASSDSEAATVADSYVSSWSPGSYLGTFSASVPTNLPQGQYKVYPVTSPDNSIWTRATAAVGLNNYATINKDASGNISIVELNEDGLQFSGPIFTTSLYLDTPFMVEASVINRSDKEILKDVRLCFYDSSDNLVAGCATMNLDLLPGQTIPLDDTYEIVSGELSAGVTYRAAFMESYSNKVISDFTYVTLKESPGNGSLVGRSFTIHNQYAVNPDDFRISYSVKCTSGVFVNRLLMYIYDENYDFVDVVFTKTIFAEEGDVVTVENECVAMPELEAGKTYYAWLHDSKNYDEMASLTPFVVDSSYNSVDSVEQDRSDAEVEYYNLQGVKVANPDNGIFIRRQGNKVSKVILK